MNIIYIKQEIYIFLVSMLLIIVNNVQMKIYV